MWWYAGIPRTDVFAFAYFHFDAVLFEYRAHGVHQVVTQSHPFIVQFSNGGAQEYLNRLHGLKVFVQRYWIDGTKIGNFFKLRQVLDCFVLCSDAKRQWGQSPEIEDSTESKDDPTSPRYAMSGFHIMMDDTAAAIDARRRTSLRWQDMAAGAIRIMIQGMTWLLESSAS